MRIGAWELERRSPVAGDPHREDDRERLDELDRRREHHRDQEADLAAIHAANDRRRPIGCPVRASQRRNPLPSAEAIRKPSGEKRAAVTGWPWPSKEGPTSSWMKI